jgi:hypothetical protein
MCLLLFVYSSSFFSVPFLYRTGGVVSSSSSLTPRKMSLTRMVYEMEESENGEERKKKRKAVDEALEEKDEEMKDVQKRLEVALNQVNQIQQQRAAALDQVNQIQHQNSELEKKMLHVQHDLVEDIKAGRNAIIRGVLERELAFLKKEHTERMNSPNNSIHDRDKQGQYIKQTCRDFHKLAAAGTGKQQYLMHWRECPYINFTISKKLMHTPSCDKLPEKAIQSAIDGLYASISSHLHGTVCGDIIIIPSNLPHTERVAVANVLQHLGLIWEWQENVDKLALLPQSSSSPSPSPTSISVKHPSASTSTISISNGAASVSTSSSALPLVSAGGGKT